MKTSSILIVCIMLMNSLIIIAQKKEVELRKIQNRNGVYYQDDMPYSGKGFEYYSNGKVKTEVNFKNGYKHGTEISFYSSGNTQEIKYYKFNEPDSIWLNYAFDGTIQGMSHYEKDIVTISGFSKGNRINKKTMKKIDNNWIYDGYYEFYDQFGKIKTKYKYLAGAVVEHTIFCENNEIPKLTTCFYSDSLGRKYRKDIDYYPDGKVRSIKEILEGFITGQKGHGSYLEFYPDSTIKASGELFKGEKHGIWHEFDSTGFEKITTYEYGIEVAYNSFNLRAFRDNSGKYGMKDVYENIVITPKYYNIEYSPNYDCEVYVTTNYYGNKGLIDSKGEILVEPIYKKIEYTAGYQLAFCGIKKGNRLIYKTYSIRQEKFLADRCTNYYCIADFIITIKKLRKTSTAEYCYKIRLYNREGSKIRTIKCKTNDLKGSLMNILIEFFPYSNFPELYSSTN